MFFLLLLTVPHGTNGTRTLDINTNTLGSTFNTIMRANRTRPTTQRGNGRGRGSGGRGSGGRGGIGNVGRGIVGERTTGTHVASVSRSKPNPPRTSKKWIQAYTTNINPFMIELDNLYDYMDDGEKQQWDIWKDDNLMSVTSITNVGNKTGKPGASNIDIIENIFSSIPTLTKWIETRPHGNNGVQWIYKQKPRSTPTHTKKLVPNPASTTGVQDFFPKSNPPGQLKQPSSDDSSMFSISSDILNNISIDSTKLHVNYEDEELQGDSGETRNLESELVDEANEDEGEESDNLNISLKLSDTHESDLTTAIEPQRLQDAIQNAVNEQVTTYMEANTDLLQSALDHALQTTLNDALQTALADNHLITQRINRVTDEAVANIEQQLQQAVHDRVVSNVTETKLKATEDRIRQQITEYNNFSATIDAQDGIISQLKIIHSKIKHDISTQLQRAQSTMNKQQNNLTKIGDKAIMDFNDNAHRLTMQATEIDQEWEDRQAYISESLDYCESIKSTVEENVNGTRYVSVDGTDEYIKVENNSSDGVRYIKKNDIYIRQLDVQDRNRAQGLPTDFNHNTNRNNPPASQFMGRPINMAAPIPDSPFTHGTNSSSHHHSRSQINTKQYERSAKNFHAIESHMDIIQHYNQQFTTAQGFKIPLRHLDDIHAWSDQDDQAPTFPSDTIPDEEQQTLYHQAGGAIFNMLTKIISSEYNDGRRILNNYSNTRDGYGALYQLLRLVLPHLNSNAYHISEPTYDANLGGIYQYRDNMITYVNYKQSMFPNTLPPNEVANQFLAHLRTKMVYGDGVTSARAKLDKYDNALLRDNSDNHQSGRPNFPHSLMLQQIATTVMEACSHEVQTLEAEREKEYYNIRFKSKDESGTISKLYGTQYDEDDDESEAIVKYAREGGRFRGKGKPASSTTTTAKTRIRSKLYCGACKTVGHTIDDEQGCPFAVKSFHVNSYMSKPRNETTMKKAIGSYKEWQTERKKKMQASETKPQYSKSSIRALTSFSDTLFNDEVDTDYDESDQSSTTTDDNSDDTEEE